MLTIKNKINNTKQGPLGCRFEYNHIIICQKTLLKLYICLFQGLKLLNPTASKI